MHLVGGNFLPKQTRIIFVIRIKPSLPMIQNFHKLAYRQTIDQLHGRIECVPPSSRIHEFKTILAGIRKKEMDQQVESQNCCEPFKASDPFLKNVLLLSYFH